ncbi:hypothetical protein MmTuc01_3447 [Methanosarcina mazei Tuc01]|uniref:Uncharacterized protein n=1 Tax=Methanosarcina mazei Tuc01 TaxID=1236903 RepID=M1Q294_METMZ|nr:hypothetical protein MmTuc01_3447 [Methanosarcina mazei Tuc01]
MYRTGRKEINRFTEEMPAKSLSWYCRYHHIFLADAANF